MSTKERSSGRVDGKVALVTGAAAGIGKAIAKRLAAEGAQVAVADIDQPGAAKTVGEIEAMAGIARAFMLDVSQEHRWEDVVAQVVSRWNKLDVLVNSAAIAFAKPLHEMTLDEWQRLMAVNLNGVFLGTKYAITAMRQGGAGGSIINISSVSGIKASAASQDGTAYCTSKAAIIHFSRAAALECARYGDGIRINSVLPGIVPTPMWTNMHMWQEFVAKMGSEQAAWDMLTQSVPFKRPAKPEEIAAAVLYLASDEAKFVTATKIIVDGGVSA